MRIQRVPWNRLNRNDSQSRTTESGVSPVFPNVVSHLDPKVFSGYDSRRDACTPIGYTRTMAWASERSEALVFKEGCLHGIPLTKRPRLHCRLQATADKKGDPAEHRVEASVSCVLRPNAELTNAPMIQVTVFLPQL